MPQLHDESNVDDDDGTEWTQQNTHMEPEQYVDPILSALHLISDLAEDGYTADWKSIAANMRRERNYTCEECKVNLSEFKWLLHVHHLDRNKQNNTEGNLRVLCVICHSLPDDHRHLRVHIRPGDKHLIQCLRSDSLPEVNDAAIQIHNKSERREETYGRYRLVVAHFRGQFRGKAWPQSGLQLKHLAATANSICGAHAKIRRMAQIETQIAIIHRHRIFQEKFGRPSHLRYAIGGSRRSSHCYKCKETVNGLIDLECTTCGWLVCARCASCGCGYSG